jgi:hypothetical protein
MLRGGVIDSKGRGRQARRRDRCCLEMARASPHKARGHEGPRGSMPTLFRILVVIGLITGVIYGGMYALANFVEPKKGEMTVRIPPEKLNPKPSTE